MTRGVIQPERSPQVTDLLIRQKAEVMILWAYTALRQFPKHERHVFPLGRVYGRGLAFVGFRLWPSHRLLTRASVVRIRRNLTRLVGYYREGLVSLTRVQQGNWGRGSFATKVPLVLQKLINKIERSLDVSSVNQGSKQAAGSLDQQQLTATVAGMVWLLMWLLET